MKGEQPPRGSRRELRRQRGAPGARGAPRRRRRQTEAPAQLAGEAATVELGVRPLEWPSDPRHARRRRHVREEPEANFVLSIVENSEEPGEVLSGADREKGASSACARPLRRDGFSSARGAAAALGAPRGARRARMVEIVAPRRVSPPLAARAAARALGGDAEPRGRQGVRVRGGRASALAGGNISGGGFGSAPGHARGVRDARARRRSRRRARRVRRDDVLPRGLHARRRRPPPRPRRGSGGAERERRRRGGDGAEGRQPFRAVRRARRRRAGGPRGAPPAGRVAVGG